MKKRRDIEIFSLSFLDVVSCGFGAIILLLVVSQFAEPLAVEHLRQGMTGQISRLERERRAIEAGGRTLRRKLDALDEQLSQIEKETARLRDELSSVREEIMAARAGLKDTTAGEDALRAARQRLTEEMRRLSRPASQRRDRPVIGGIPVDSEYIVFIIDTSGSMQNYAWPLVRRKMREILDAYPRVKGIQVMNDMGDYLFSQYAGRWIPDSPARRRAILSAIVSWKPFSNSSPVEGITAAIRAFYATDKKISLYVFGDDFAKGDIQDVLDTVARLNRKGEKGRRRVRIHAIGFPVLLRQTPASDRVIRFSTLMRRLAEDNDGSFVGLNALQ